MKQTEHIVDPAACLSLNLKVLKLGSISPYDLVSTPIWTNILYKGYTTFTILLFITTSIGAPLFIFCTSYPLEDGIEVMSILLTQIRSGMKLMTFVSYRKEVRKLIAALYENFYIHGKHLDVEESNLVQESMDYARRIITSYIMLFSFTGMSMALHPLTHSPPDLTEEGNLNQTNGPRRILPFKTWYPNWDTTKSPQYEIEYLCQATIALLEAWCMACTDTFCVTLMIYVGCQFDLLSRSLKNMNKNVLLKCGNGMHIKRMDKRSAIPLKVEIFANETNVSVITNKETAIPNVFQVNSGRCDTTKEGNQELSTEDTYNQIERETMAYIKNCVKHHQALLTYVEDMNKLFSFMFFIVFLTASLLICLLGFQVIVMPPEGLMFVRVFLHSLCTIFELGFFCWFGSELMYKSENVHSAAYESEWQDHSNGAKKCISMVIMRAQRPVAVQAGLFGDLCLPTFSSLMKNSYSYLALLRQLHEGDDA